MDGTSQQVDTGIAAGIKSVTVNIIWKILHSRWTLELQLKKCVTVNIEGNIGAWRLDKYDKWTFLFWSFLEEVVSTTLYNAPQGL